MTKKYFINNLDSDFGQALISELVKEPTEDPTHMCTVRVPADKKPQGMSFSPRNQEDSQKREAKTLQEESPGVMRGLCLQYQSNRSFRY